MEQVYSAFGKIAVVGNYLPRRCGIATFTTDLCEALAAVSPRTSVLAVSVNDPNFFKDQLGVEGRVVLLTFGLISPNKGVENVIDALPEILRRHPRVVYLVVGATHPHLLRREGEAYRRSLEDRTRARRVEEHVVFADRFVSLAELIEIIGAADVYLTPYLSQEQIVSGTLAYALGAGKAVVSTPYWYAQELLDEGSGVLVPFADPGAIATAVCALLENETERHAMRKRGYLLGREMVWSRVAERYFESFARCRAERLQRPRRVLVARPAQRRPLEAPAVELGHLLRLTDDTGLLQHAVFGVPNYAEGYTTDDNARALLLAVLLERTGCEGVDASALAARLLAFLWNAFLPEAGHFVPIGSRGFYPRHGERARFDQQPVEAQETVAACLSALELTGDARWRDEARCAHDWFLGRNDLGVPLYDPVTGGCRDGLQPDRVNQNQGAESTLAALLATLEMRISDAAFAPLEQGRATERPWSRSAWPMATRGSSGVTRPTPS